MQGTQMTGEPVLDLANHDLAVHNLPVLDLDLSEADDPLMGLMTLFCEDDQFLLAGVQFPLQPTASSMNCSFR